VFNLRGEWVPEVNYPHGGYVTLMNRLLPEGCKISANDPLPLAPTNDYLRGQSRVSSEDFGKTAVKKLPSVCSESLMLSARQLRN
jgi:hypothetical protein